MILSATFPQLAAYELDKLIGTPYVYGETDCIWMTLTVLKALDIPAPALNPDWYKMPAKRWARDLLLWGDRISKPEYDGDIIIEPEPAGFSITWQNGFFHICKIRNAVSWSPLNLMNESYYLTNGALFKRWVFRSKNIERYV